MKNLITISILLALFFYAVPFYAEEDCCSTQTGCCAGYSSRDATVLSMMCWGIGLAVGIGLLCGFLAKSDNAHAH